MSRIATVQKALEGLLTHLNTTNIDISVVFFNHTHKVITTLPIIEQGIVGNLSTEEIINHINTTPCFGSTEFSQIKTAINKIKKNCPIEKWNNTLSFITSDGQQTTIVSPDSSIEEDDLTNFFDYSVGIGNQETDFDKPFLIKISKNFVFGKSSEIINKSIYNILENIRATSKKIDELHVYIPPHIKVSSLCDKTIINVDADIMMEEMQNIVEVEPKEIVDFVWIQDENNYTFAFKVNMNEDEINKKKYVHLIFVIDISSSMDESLDLYSTYLHPIEYGESIDTIQTIELIHDFLWKRLTFRNFFNNYLYLTLISFPDYVLIEYNKKLVKVKCGNYDSDAQLKKLFSFFNKISQVLNDFNMKSSREEKVNILDTLFTYIKEDNVISGIIVDIDANYPSYSYIMKNFTKEINSLYFTFLTRKEITFFNLLHEKIDFYYDNSLVVHEDVQNKIDPHLCLICYKNSRNILLSCSHISMCQSCTTQSINYSTLSCPICRAESSFIKKINPFSENLKCISLNCNNQISILYDNCYHIYYCIDCFLNAEENICLCGNKTSGIYSVQFS